MLNLLSLFSGIGAFEKALDRLGAEYNLVNYCETDKHASVAYSAVHGVPESKNLGDITKVDTSQLPKDIDLICYGFPCQDISVAGKRKGFFNEDGTQTRSGLFFEALRIIEDTKPQIAIAENVKNLTGKKMVKEFQVVLESLERTGYNNYWQVLNAKDYGIPQNRERVFIVSIRKDIDTGDFEFPRPLELKLRIQDLLDAVVDERYYCAERDYCVMKNTNYRRDSYRKNTNKLIEGTYPSFAIMDYRYDEGLRVRAGGLSPTLTTKSGGLTGKPLIYSVDNKRNTSADKGRRIRHLTPLECWRLMGFDDEDFYKAEKVCSNAQLYKQAGNSIVVNVLVKIFTNLLKN